MIDCNNFLSFSQFYQSHGALDATLCAFQKAPISADAAGSSLWLIIALPLLGAFICGVFGRTLGRANVNLIACASVFGSFLLSLLVYWTAADYGSLAYNPYSIPVNYAVGSDLGTWFAAGDFRVNFGL